MVLYSSTSYYCQLVMSVEEFKLIPLLHSMEADLDKRIRLMSEM